MIFTPTCLALQDNQEILRFELSEAKYRQKNVTRLEYLLFSGIKVKPTQGKKMSYVSIREVTPIRGKEIILEERMKALSAVMANHGAKSALYYVAAGDGAGRFDLQNWYASIEDGAQSFQAYGADPEYQAIMNKRAADPVGDVVGPWIGRMLYGAPKGLRPVVVHRDYHAPRNALAKAIELAPQLDALMQEIDVEVGLGAPMMKDDHEMFRVVYRFNSMTHWGQSVDKMIADDRFASLVNEAHEAATLRSSRLLVLK